MSKESYIRGFCKAAETAGVDPKALAKFAQQGVAALENQAKAEMARQRTRPGTTTMLSPKMQQLLQKLQAAKGRKIKGFDGTRFQYA